MASKELILLLGIVFALAAVGGLHIALLWRRVMRLSERADLQDVRLYEHRHSLSSGTVLVPRFCQLPPPPAPPPSSGPVAVISSTRDEVDPLAQTAVVVAQVDDRDTIVELATTMPSAGEVRR